MKLSIIIVNYNVKDFLDQCLYSVKNAITSIDAEVWVVDNASTDESNKILPKKYPWVNWVENKKNVGFSVANNQAIKKAKGEYVLLLNPDTVVAEDTFEKCISYMDQHPGVGGLGVKMIDGLGNFLPESKRGLPTPLVAFYKIFGLASRFSKSPRFARYYMGHLPNEETHEIDVLAGAYMFMRKSVLDKIGLLDESFFMYGEDIDLSYRIQKAGFKNIYYPETRIIHYKGESTKKGSINYVWIFYRAMVIFAQKHFSKRYSFLYSLVIYLAIYVRMGLSIVKRILKKTLPIAADFLWVYLIFYGSMLLWQDHVRFQDGGQYPEIFPKQILPAYALLMLLGIALFGGYKKPTKVTRLLYGFGLGIAFVAGFYSMIPEDLRFSRAVILLGGSGTFLYFIFSRLLGNLFGGKAEELFKLNQKRIALYAEPNSMAELENLVQDIGESESVILKSSLPLSGDACIQQRAALNLTDIYFHPKGKGYKTFFQIMEDLKGRVRIKTIIPKEGVLIGSDSIDHSGETRNRKTYRLSQPKYIRAKRAFDVLTSIWVFLLFPMVIWKPKKMGKLLNNILPVFFGYKTWVGFTNYPEGFEHLPKGVVFPVHPDVEKSDSEIANLAKTQYVRTYDVNLDFYYIISFLKNLN